MAAHTPSTESRPGSYLGSCSTLSQPRSPIRRRMFALVCRLRLSHTSATAQPPVRGVHQRNVVGLVEGGLPVGALVIGVQLIQQPRPVPGFVAAQGGHVAPPRSAPVLTGCGPACPRWVWWAAGYLGPPRLRSRSRRPGRSWCFQKRSHLVLPLLGSFVVAFGGASHRDLHAPHEPGGLCAHQLTDTSRHGTSLLGHGRTGRETGQGSPPVRLQRAPAAPNFVWPTASAMASIWDSRASGSVSRSRTCWCTVTPGSPCRRCRCAVVPGPAA